MNITISEILETGTATIRRARPTISAHEVTREPIVEVCPPFYMERISAPHEQIETSEDNTDTIRLPYVEGIDAHMPVNITVDYRIVRGADIGSNYEDKYILLNFVSCSIPYKV